MNHIVLTSFTDVNSYTPVDILTIVLAVAAIIISVLALAHQRKELKLSAVLEIFKFLSTQEQRGLRGVIFDVYQYLYPEGVDKAKKEGKAGRMVFDENYPIKSYIKRVSSPFDQAGVLVKKRMINAELFFDLYAEMVVRVWKVLEEDIMKERERNKEVCRWFMELKDDAEKYLQKKGIQIPLPYKRAQILNSEEIKNLIKPQTRQSDSQRIKDEEKAKLEAKDEHIQDRFSDPRM